MRDRRVGLRELLVAVAAFLLVPAACSGDEESVEISGATSSTTSSTVAVATSTTSSSPPESNATTTTTTTIAPALPFSGIGETVLVTADDGVYQIGPEGDVTMLVQGPVAYAIDDTQGGLLFQVNRGRWDEDHRSSTIVWWMPRGASRPQELLVPTPGAGQRLSLHDAYATDDGFAVIYIRHDGVTPHVDITSGDVNDRLRRFDVPAGKVTELESQGAFEQGYGEVSTNGRLISGVWLKQVGSECFIYDLDGDPTDLVPPEVSDPHSDDYVRGCGLSPDGNQLLFFTERSEVNELAFSSLHIWDLVGGFEVNRLIVPASFGSPSDLDVSATGAMAGYATIDGQRTMVFDFTAPDADPVVLPLLGRARFVDTPVEIVAPVQVGAGPDYYRYGDDGLYRVVNGVETQLEAQPVTWAVDDLMGGVVFRQPYDVSDDVLWLGAGAAEPELLPVEGVWDASIVDGRPVLLVNLADPQGELCSDHDDFVGGPVVLHDLTTGKQTFLFCDYSGEWAGWSITSLGASLVASVEWFALPGLYTDSSIVFIDLSGQDVPVEANPVVQPCRPCLLDALLSDDGSLLAYTMWPTAFWDVPVENDDYTLAYETWRAEVERVPVEVAVLDLANGRALWHATIDPGVRLAGFDGRYLALGPSHAVDFGVTGSVIYDTWGIHEPVEVDGGVALIRQSVTDVTEITLRADGLGIASFGEPAEDVLATMTSLLGPPDSEEFVDPFADQVALPYGFAASRYFRLSRWDRIGLYLVFSDSDYFREDGEPHFVGWGVVTQPGLQTEAGIGVGSTADELVAAYGDAVALPDSFLDECGQGWAFRIGSAIPWDDPDYIVSMRGEFDGDPQDPTSQVTGLRGGADSDC